MKSPYHKHGNLDTKLEVTVERYVADAIKTMATHSKLPEGEIVNTALRRYISTHSDLFPGRKAPKDPIR